MLKAMFFSLDLIAESISKRMRIHKSTIFFIIWVFACFINIFKQSTVADSFACLRNQW